MHAVYEAVHLFHGVGVGSGVVKGQRVKFGAGIAVDEDGLNRRTVCVLEHEGDASGIDRMFSAGGIDLPDLELLGHSGGILIIVRVAVRDDDGIAVGAGDRAGGSERAGLAVDRNRGAPAVGAERFRFLDRPYRPGREIGEGDGLVGLQGQNGFAVFKQNALQLVRGIFTGDCIVDGLPV